MKKVTFVPCEYCKQEGKIWDKHKFKVCPNCLGKCQIPVITNTDRI